jgi:hypothetical protein
MMNTVNASSGYSGFQLHSGHSPRIIPPLVPDTLGDDLHNTTEAEHAQTLIHCLHNNVNDAKDNLLQVKVFQAHFANTR